MAKAIFWQWWRSDIPSNWTLDDHKDYWIEPTDLLTNRTQCPSRKQTRGCHEIPNWIAKPTPGWGFSILHFSKKKKHPQTSINLFFLWRFHPFYIQKKHPPNRSPNDGGIFYPKRISSLTWSCSATWKANSHRFAFSKALLLAAKDTTVASWKGRIVQSRVGKTDLFFGRDEVETFRNAVIQPSTNSKSNCKKKKLVSTSPSPPPKNRGHVSSSSLPKKTQKHWKHDWFSNSLSQWTLKVWSFERLIFPTKYEIPKTLSRLAVGQVS